MRPDVTNIVGLLKAGADAQRAERQATETDKVGTLRGGNSGVLIHTDEGLRSIGGCARKALLRMLGIELADEEDYHSKILMFQFGVSNEASLLEHLNYSWEGVIKREEEIPTRWETTSGVPVSGRPDIVLCDKDGKPVVGIEAKQASSLWTCRDILKDAPKTNHLAQAAHYSWQLGVPFHLVYTNRVNFAVLGNHLPWVNRHFPKYGARHSEKLDYEMGKESGPTPEKVYKNGNVKPAKGPKPGYMEPFRIRPFVHSFRLRWDEDGTMHVGPEDLGPEAEQKTLITKDGLKAYYETAADALSSDVLPPEPVALDAFGEEAKYRECLYCPLNSVCETYADGKKPQRVSEWLRDVRSAVEGRDVKYTNKTQET